MHYTRLELRFLPRGWSGGQLIEGVVGGHVRGIAVEIESGQIEYTLIQPRRGTGAQHTEAHSAGTARSPLPSGLARLTQHTRVFAGSAPAGWISEVWCDRQSRAITHVLVGPRRLFARPAAYVVEAAKIATYADDKVDLKIAPAELARLPIFRPDTAIAADLGAALADAIPDPRTRRAVKTRVEDGHIFLGGVVDTPEVRQIAQNTAVGIRGVRGVTSDIIIAESLDVLVEAALAQRLASLPPGAADVRAFTEHGIVYLEGKAPDAPTRAALESAAVGIPGVRVVVNNLLLPGEAPSRARDTGPLTRNK